MEKMKTTSDRIIEETSNAIQAGLSLSFHNSFYVVHDKIKRWIHRFSHTVDSSVFDDLVLVFLLATKNQLDHRHSVHLFRLVLSIHIMQKDLLRKMTYAGDQRHLKIKWIPAELIFPFSHRPVMGCVIGYNRVDRYEVFDEENIVLTLQKHMPDLRLVPGSTYSHQTANKGIDIVYFEIEKEKGESFSLSEMNLLKKHFENKVKRSIQQFSPRIYLDFNDEEIYKNALVLSQEIQSLEDLPQACINYHQQTGKEIVFLVNLVHFSPFHRFSLSERFFDCRFVSKQVLTIRHLQGHPIQTHVFCLHLPRQASLLRSDGSVDFHATRQVVVSLIEKAIGKFRDYNGGILIKQREQLQSFKEQFEDISSQDSELIESFFYSLTPLEKQVILPIEIFSILFQYYVDFRKKTLPPKFNYFMEVNSQNERVFLTIYGNDLSLKDIVTDLIQTRSSTLCDIAYNFLESGEGLFFNCVVLKPEDQASKTFISALQNTLDKWNQSLNEKQVLRVAMEFSAVSMDPRIGGETVSGDILRLLFEGLTRFNQNGQLENAVAEEVEVSPDLYEYTFYLRHVFWNNGSPLTAYDFEHSWKSVLSPHFNTSFGYYFYPIKNAKLAKEGKVPESEIGIKVIDDRTLKVILEKPTPYFLQMTAHPIYSPIHRFIDKQFPQWPYQSEKKYPCNGPFQLKLNQGDRGFQLIKNPFYRELPLVSLDTITFIQMNPVQTIMSLQRNEIDWVGSPFSSWYPLYNSYKAEKKEKIVTVPDIWILFLWLNTFCPLLQNCKLRQALSYAVDRSQIIAGAFIPLNPAYSPLLPRHRGGTQSCFPEHNTEMAQKLFKEALTEMGMKKNEFPPLEISFCEKGIREYTAICLQEQLRENLGIEVKLKSYPWKKLFEKVAQGDYQMSLLHCTGWVDDPIYTFRSFRIASIGKDYSFSHWNNEDFNKLLESSGEEVNPFQRSLHLLKAVDILVKEVPAIPLFDQPHQSIVNNEIEGFYNEPCGAFNLGFSYRKKGEA